MAYRVEPAFCDSLRTQPFQAQPPQQKAAVLAFLVHELNGSTIIIKWGAWVVILNPVACVGVGGRGAQCSRSSRVMCPLLYYEDARMTWDRISDPFLGGCKPSIVIPAVCVQTEVPVVMLYLSFLFAATSPSKIICCCSTVRLIRHWRICLATGKTNGLLKADSGGRDGTEWSPERESET